MTEEESDYNNDPIFKQIIGIKTIITPVNRHGSKHTLEYNI